MAEDPDTLFLLSQGESSILEQLTLNLTDAGVNKCGGKICVRPEIIACILQATVVDAVQPLFEALAIEPDLQLDLMEEIVFGPAFSFTRPDDQCHNLDSAYNLCTEAAHAIISKRIHASMEKWRQVVKSEDGYANEEQEERILKLASDANPDLAAKVTRQKAWLDNKSDKLALIGLTLGILKGNPADCDPSEEVPSLSILEWNFLNDVSGKGKTKA
jgi:hypothetical protein